MRIDKWFEVTKAGKDSGLTEDDLQSLVETYNPKKLEACVTVDHMQYGRSLGWIDTIEKRDKSLYAHVYDMDKDLIEAIEKKQYKRISIEYYKDFRNSGKPYFAAFSFLGASEPAVLGMEDPTKAFLSQDENGNKILGSQLLLGKPKIKLMDKIKKYINSTIRQELSASQNSESGNSRENNYKEFENMDNNYDSNNLNFEKSLLGYQKEIESLKKALSDKENETNKLKNMVEVEKIKLDDSKKEFEKQKQEFQNEFKQYLSEIKQQKKIMEIDKKLLNLKNAGILNPQFIQKGGKALLCQLPDMQIEVVEKLLQPDESGNTEKITKKDVVDVVIELSAKLDKPIKTNTMVPEMKPKKLNLYSMDFASNNEDFEEVSNEIETKIAELMSKDKTLNYEIAASKVFSMFDKGVNHG